MRRSPGLPHVPIGFASDRILNDIEDAMAIKDEANAAELCLQLRTMIVREESPPPHWSACPTATFFYDKLFKGTK